MRFARDAGAGAPGARSTVGGDASWGHARGPAWGLLTRALLALLIASAVAALSTSAASAAAPVCVLHSLPSFVDQGEFAQASSIADIVEVECQPVFAEQEVKFSSIELYDSCNHELKWSKPFPYEPQAGSSISAELDDDGNAAVVVWGGPSCAPSTSQIAAHLVHAPYTTVTAQFTVLPPDPTKPGVRALPASEVEDATDSSLATIVQVEFPPVYAEQYVTISDEQLYDACGVAPRLTWTGPQGEVLGEEEEGVTKVKLDNDGNAFVALLAGASCAPVATEIEASLEDAPYTTYTTTFTVLPPQPTVEAEPTSSFTVEKLQRLGSGAYTTARLKGKIGETIHYEIVMKNTGQTSLPEPAFTDPGCTHVTGGATELKPGATATWFCEEKITEKREYANVATVEDGGKEEPSNEVVVEVEEGGKSKKTPAFTLHKAQRVKGVGMFQATALAVHIGQTIEYQLTATNTGNVPLTFSPLKDLKCENITGGPGAGEVKPGATTTWTCEHTMENVGEWINVGTVSGTPPEGPPITHNSNEVVAYDP